MHEEEKELATDRLLEILRADVEEDVEEKEVSIPLSEKEVQAILATKDSKKKEKKKRGFSIPKQKIDYKKLLEGLPRTGAKLLELKRKREENGHN